MNPRELFRIGKISCELTVLNSAEKAYRCSLQHANVVLTDGFSRVRETGNIMKMPLRPVNTPHQLESRRILAFSEEKQQGNVTPNNPTLTWMAGIVLSNKLADKWQAQ